MKVIDVSEYNEIFDWTSVKKDGIEGVIIRAGIGSRKDIHFEDNYKGASDAGLHIGTYWYTKAHNVDEAVQEAQVFLECIKGKKFDMPVYFDIEDDIQQSLSIEICTDITNAFMSVLETAGYCAGVYSYDAFFDGNLDIEIQTKYEIWVARVNNPDEEYDESKYVAPQYVTKWGMHQYTWKGKVNGITGDVDLDSCIKDYPTIIKNAGLNGYSKQQDICDIFKVSASIGGMTVTMVQNRSKESQESSETFTFNTKTYKTITTLRSGNTTIDKTWNKTVINEVLKNNETVWELNFDNVGNLTAVLDSVGNDVLNGTTGNGGNYVITPTPEGIALGWALAYNNEHDSAFQKTINIYKNGIDDCDEINRAEGVGGGNGDGEGGNGNGDGTGDGTSGIRLPEKEFEKRTEITKNDDGTIPIPTGSGAVREIEYSDVVNGELGMVYKCDCIIVDVTRGTK